MVKYTSKYVKVYESKKGYRKSKYFSSIFMLSAVQHFNKTVSLGLTYLLLAFPSGDILHALLNSTCKSNYLQF